MALKFSPVKLHAGSKQARPDWRSSSVPRSNRKLVFQSGCCNQSINDGGLDASLLRAC